MTVELKSDSGQEAALAFCKHLLQVLRLIRLYDPSNVTFNEPLGQLKEVVIQVTDRQGAARLQSEEGMLYFNKDPVRGGRRAFNTIQGLVKAFEGFGLAELAFTGAVSTEDLRAFMSLLKPPEGQDMVPLAEVKAKLEAAGLKDKVQVYAPGETTGSAQVHQVEIDESTYFPLAYARTLVLLREYVKNLRQEELNRYFTQKLHRALQELCGMVAKYPHKFVAMGSVKGADEYLYNHMANTGFLAILLGHNLGVSRVRLSDLALGAMLHALGRFRGPHQLLRRAELGPDEEAEEGLHPYRALAAMLEGHKLTTKTLTSAVVALQYDLHRGRTPVRLPPRYHPFAMIVRVCEEYDALTSELEDRPALTPDQTIKALIEAPPEQYDPLILTVFTNMMGLYPCGTTVSLSSGEVAVVVHPNPDQPKRPLVAVVLDREGSPVDGDFLDLAEKVDGRYPATITGTLDPSELGIKVPEHLL